MYFDRLKLDHSHIDSAFYEKVLNNLEPQKFRKGNIIYPIYNAQLDSVKIIFFKSGRAKSIFNDDGEEFILYMLEKENIDIIGGTCMIEFLETSEVYIEDIDTIFKMLPDAEFSQMILSSIIQKSVTERRIIKHLALGKCKKRVAFFLLDMALHYKSEQIPLDFDLSVQELSNFIGSKRQTVSSIFNELLKEDIISKTEGKHFVINSIERLRAYAKCSV